MCIKKDVGYLLYSSGKPKKETKKKNKNSLSQIEEETNKICSNGKSVVSSLEKAKKIQGALNLRGSKEKEEVLI